MAEVTRSGWEQRAFTADGTARLAGPGEVRVLRGVVVVTQTGDPADHVLRAGEALRLPRRGRIVAWALEEAALEWRRVHRGATRPSIAACASSSSPEPAPTPSPS